MTAIAPSIIAAAAAVGGGLVGGATTMLGNYRLADRRAEHERVARQEEAEQRRTERLTKAALRRTERAEEAAEVRAQSRRQFQRETFIALQDALATYVRANGEAHQADLVHHRTTGEPWGTQQLEEELSDRIFASNVEVLKLSARVEDEQLQGMLQDFRDQAATVGFAPSERSATARQMEMVNRYTVVVDRLSVLFRSV